MSVFKGRLPFRKCSEAQENVASLISTFYISEVSTIGKAGKINMQFRKVCAQLIML